MIDRKLTEQLQQWLDTKVEDRDIATGAMLKAGATSAATGENAVRVCARNADVIAGPIGIVLADAMMGEITADMAAAVATSRAHRVLVPVQRCATTIAGVSGQSLQQLLDDAVEQIVRLA